MWQFTKLCDYIFLDATLNGFQYTTVNRRLNHADAQRHCETLGATIASIHSAEENSFINTINTRGVQFNAAQSSNFRDVWIGFVTGSSCSCLNRPRDACAQCRSEWWWADASAVDYIQFAPTHPLGGGRNCGRMLYSGGDWHSAMCGTELKSVCKKGNVAVEFRKLCF